MHVMVCGPFELPKNSNQLKAHGYISFFFIHFIILKNIFIDYFFLFLFIPNGKSASELFSIIP